VHDVLGNAAEAIQRFGIVEVAGDGNDAGIAQPRNARAVRKPTSPQPTISKRLMRAFYPGAAGPSGGRE
jgi:hypothetical protein